MLKNKHFKELSVQSLNTVCYHFRSTVFKDVRTMFEDFKNFNF